MVIAQRGPAEPETSIHLNQYVDFFQASLNNHYTELCLGRNYNFRKIDKSYTYNQKTRKEIRHRFKVARRSDLLQTKDYQQGTLLVTLNDMQESLNFLKKNAPNPRLIWLKRSSLQIAINVAQKGWLSNKSLAFQSDLTPAYKSMYETKFGTMYVPYFVGEAVIDEFFQLSDLDRAYYYALVQETKFLEFQKSFPDSIQVVNLRDVFLSGTKELALFSQNLDLKMTKKSSTVAKKIAKEVEQMSDATLHYDSSKVELLLRKE
jgi:hypothetical protein